MNSVQKSYKRSTYQKLNKHPDAVETHPSGPETLRPPDGVPSRKNLKQSFTAAAQFVGKIAESTVKGAGLGTYLVTRGGMREGLHLGRRAGEKVEDITSSKFMSDVTNDVVGVSSCVTLGVACLPVGLVVGTVYGAVHPFKSSHRDEKSE